jgi:hypothetical protein
MPTARTGLGVGVINGILYAVGGNNSSGTFVNTVEAYNPTTNTWTTEASMPTSRSSLSVLARNGILYALGGFNGTIYYNNVESYNPTTNQWTELAPMLTSINALEAVLINNVPYAVGGSTSTGASSVLEYYSQPFAAWQTANFTATQLANSSFIASNATPFKDGVSNLLKYLFDINPSQFISATDETALPVVGINSISGTSYLTLTYRQNSLMTGITVNVQTSPDLQNWTTISPSNPSYISQNAGTDPITSDPIMQVGVKTSGSKMFIRLNVTMP